MRRRRRYRRARENPTGRTWLLVGLGVAAAGTAVYFMTRPSATTATTPVTAPAPLLSVTNSTTPPLPTPSTSGVVAPLVSGGVYQLVVAGPAGTPADPTRAAA